MKCVSRPFCVLATAGLFALAVAHTALAQEAEGDDIYGDEDAGAASVAPPATLQTPKAKDETPALRRKRSAVGDPYEAQGIRLGALRLYPTLELGTIATSNAGAKPAGAEGDMGLRLRPGLRLQSDWSRHRLTANASADFVRYLEQDQLSSKSADVSATLRLDVRHGTFAEIDGGYTLTSTGTSSSEVPDTAVGNRISHALSTGLAVTHDMGDTDWKIRGGVRRELFEDVELSGGGTEDNGDRNYTELDVSLRGTFNRGAVIRPYAELSYTPRFHDETVDRNGLRRDSQGYAATLGLRIDDDSVWSGEAGVSYVVRYYRDPALKTLGSPGVLANLQWRPTELTTVDFSTAMGISETASATESGTVNWNANAKVTHALRDNLDLVGASGISFSKSGSAVDRTHDLSAGVEWKINPELSWSLFYQGTWLVADTPADSYDEQRLISSIILKR